MTAQLCFQPSSLDPRIKRALEAGQGEHLPIRELARIAGISASQLTRLFRKEFGLSPLQVFKGLRLREAQHLLASTSLSVKEVAHYVGLHDLSHFVRDFESAYGLSPVEYRRRNKLCNPPRTLFLTAGHGDFS